jgi:hypothetical protein
MFAVGSVVAQESVASALRISTAAKAVTITDREGIMGTAPSASEQRAKSIASGERRTDGKTSNPVEQSFNFDYRDHRIERAIDERTVDRLGLFDRPDGSSGRYSASLDLENEDSEWSFEVTITVEF